MQSLLISIVLLLLSKHTLSETKINIVTSIRPIHSMTSALTQGVAEPKLLIQGVSSPHHYALKPSDLMHLKNADLIIWLGPSLESNIGKAINSLQQHSASLVLSNNIQLTRLTKQGKHSRNQTHFDPKHEDNLDIHIWLNPLNMIVVSENILGTLKKIDPTHSDTYNRNYLALKTKLINLNAFLEQELSSVRGKHFLVAHNAYQYLEQQYQLNSIGALSNHPEQPPSGKHILYITQQIKEKSVNCLFYEPESPTKLIQQITHNNSLQSVELDYMGYHQNIGASLYFKTMHALSEKIIECLR